MNFQTTRHSLISAIRKDDEIGWARLCRDYTEPAMRFLCGRLGLSDQDAEEIWQEAMLQRDRWLPSFDPDQGKFRTWLIRVLKHRVIDEWKSREAAKRGGGFKIIHGDAPIDPNDPNSDPQWDQLEAKEAGRLDELRRHLKEMLEWKLKESGDHRENEIYLDWVLNFHGKDQKACAGKWGLTLDQFRYLCAKVEGWIATH